MSRSGNFRDLFASGCSRFRRSSRSSRASATQSFGRSRKFRRRVFRAGSGCRRSGRRRARRRSRPRLGTCSGGDHETSTAAVAENSGTERVRRFFSGTLCRHLEELSAKRCRHFWELLVTGRRCLVTSDQSLGEEVQNFARNSVTQVRPDPSTRRPGCSYWTCRRLSPPTVALLPFPASTTTATTTTLTVTVASLATSARDSIVFVAFVELKFYKIDLFENFY